MSVQDSYGLKMRVAQLGMIADTALRQIDGATAAQEDISVGRPVIRVSGDNDTEVYRHIKASDLTALAGKAIGFPIHSHWACVKGKYPAGDCVNVMRVGRVWVATAMTSKPSNDDPVNIVAADTGPSVAKTGGTVIPGWSFTGGFENDTVSGVRIVEVEVVIPQIQSSASA